MCTTDAEILIYQIDNDEAQMQKSQLIVKFIDHEMLLFTYDEIIIKIF